MSEPIEIGDVVRRRSGAAGYESYKVGHDPFVVVATSPLVWGSVVDRHNQSHIPDNLEIIAQHGTPEADAFAEAEIAAFAEAEAVEPVDDAVNSPSHYKQGGMEAIDVIEAFDLSRDYRLGNAAKYLLRAGKKDDELQDLKKAVWYLNRYISSGEGRER